MKILLIGSLGFLGSNIHKRLSQTYSVYGVDNLKFGYKENGCDGQVNEIMDFKDLDQQTLDLFDVMVFAATSNIIYAMDNCDSTYHNNFFHAGRLFNMFKGKIVNLSTTSVYGNALQIPTKESWENIKPSEPYAISKLMAEAVLKVRGNYTTLRLSNVYGANQRHYSNYCGVVGKFVHQAITKNPLSVCGHGTQTRDFTYIDDLLDAVEAAVNREAMNTEMNIASGVETSMNELITEIQSIVGPVKINTVPSRAIDGISRRCLDVSRASALLGWRPKTDLFKGLMNTVDWYYKEYNIK
jgi:UDP-glucose 4-epimerase